MRLPLRALAYAVAVADTGSISGAARRLRLSQPSLSEAIAACEAEFGFPLFVRHPARGVSPTPAGARVLAEARALLAHAEDFSHAARAMGHDPIGEISVGCFISVAPRFIPSLLAGFRGDFPRVRVAVEEGDHDAVLDGLVEGRTELALAYDYALRDGLRAEPLAHLPPHAVLPVTHRLARRASVKLAELVEEPFLLLDLPQSRDYFLGLFRTAGLEPRIGFRSRSIEMVRGMVAAEHGWSILNIVPRSPYTVDGRRIVALPLEPALPAVTIMLLSMAARPRRPAVEAFAGFVRHAFARGGMFDPQQPERVGMLRRSSDSQALSD
ncbi:LysR family transcriptional regulator [Roseomonas sp. HJA6]|uniref:LysR family transcriptional regulator n=1 Tax=Roseomonas alba TaxID=2846776 RepID=A0ABS7AAS5_9PROT|nr:LysR family transcriptional regulator [Neoroseomonas alba]MBW6399403.1 LysR family transcriptional regulator [Neoroseomonas alba]